MDDHFDIARVFEIGKFDITRLTCIAVLLSRNNLLVLKGLKSVHLRIIQMYHFRLKWERYTVCTSWWDSNFLPDGTPTFCQMGVLNSCFQILVRALSEYSFNSNHPINDYQWRKRKKYKAKFFLNFVTVLLLQIIF